MILLKLIFRLDIIMYIASVHGTKLFIFERKKKKNQIKLN